MFLEAKPAVNTVSFPKSLGGFQNVGRASNRDWTCWDKIRMKYGKRTLLDIIAKAVFALQFITTTIFVVISL